MCARRKESCHLHTHLQAPFPSSRTGSLIAAIREPRRWAAHNRCGEATPAAAHLDYEISGALPNFDLTGINVCSPPHHTWCFPLRKHCLRNLTAQLLYYTLLATTCCVRARLICAVATCSRAAAAAAVLACCFTIPPSETGSHLAGRVSPGRTRTCCHRA